MIASFPIINTPILGTYQCQLVKLQQGGSEKDLTFSHCLQSKKEPHKILSRRKWIQTQNPFLPLLSLWTLPTYCTPAASAGVGNLRKVKTSKDTKKAADSRLC